MICNAHELNAALRQLSSFADMLHALELDAERKNDWTIFPLLSKGYFVRISEINSEIRAYLQEHDTEQVAGRLQ
jgi:hypothetical protein